MSQGAGTIGCPSCGAALEAGAHFCASCGSTVNVAVGCVSCGSALEAGVRFCDSCGASQEVSPAAAGAYQAAPVGPVPCPNCATEIRPPARFCRRCGTSITGEPPVGRKSGIGSGALLGIGAVVVAVAVGAFFLLRDSGDGGDDRQVGLPEGTPTTVNESDVLVEDSAQARAELETLLARTGDKAFRVEYELAFEEKTSEISLEASFTLAAASPRFALTIDAGEDGLDFSEFGDEFEDPDAEPIEPIEKIAIITDGEKGWACFKFVGQDGECEESVIEDSDDEIDLSSIFDEVLNTGTEDELLNGQEIRGRKIAGRDARCYSMDRSEEADVNSNTTFTVCVDDAEGLPLLVEGTLSASGDLDGAVEDNTGEEGVLGGTGGAGFFDGIELGQDTIEASWSIRATSVEFKAADSDFQPIYSIVPTED